MCSIAVYLQRKHDLIGLQFFFKTCGSGLDRTEEIFVVLMGLF